MAQPVKKKVLPYVDLAELFAMPLTSLIDADFYAAESFIELIRKLGFDAKGRRDAKDFGELRMVSFNYSSPGRDGQTQMNLVEVPLLSLIPLPTLAIREAKLDFGVEILGAVESPPEASSSEPQPPLPLRSGRRPRRLQARLARAPRSASGPQMETQDRVHLECHVRVDESDLPAGLLQLLNLMSRSTVDQTIRLPYILIEPRAGKPIFSNLRDRVHLVLTLLAADGTPLANQELQLIQDKEQLFHLPTRRLTTDVQGRVQAAVRLVKTPPASPLLKTLTAISIVQDPQYGSVDATGSILVEIRMEPTDQTL